MKRKGDERGGKTRRKKTTARSERSKSRIAPFTCWSAFDFPPGVIRLSTAEEIKEDEWNTMEAEVRWNSFAAAKLAAKHNSNWDYNMDRARHIGDIELSFSVCQPSTQGRKVDTLFHDITRRPKPYYSSSLADILHEVDAGTARPRKMDELFNRDGEFYLDSNASLKGIGSITMSTLSKYCSRGTLVAEQEYGRDLLYHLKMLMNTSTLWRIPLVRVLCYISKEDFCQQLDTGKLHLKLNIYVTRLLFELISCEHIKHFMDHLIPTNTILDVDEAMHNPMDSKGPQLYTRPAKSGIDCGDYESNFTLPSILHTCVSTGYQREAVQHNFLRLNMKQYQRQTVAWMEDMETSDRGLNGMFWQIRKWKNDGHFFYFPFAGELRLVQPPLVRGGILSEEMGMGKTLEVLALIGNTRKKTLRIKKELSVQMKDDIRGLDQDSNKQSPYIHSSATLIVVPLTLLSQWICEVEKTFLPGSFSFVVYDGKKDKKEERLQFLASHDIVFAHYGDLGNACHLRKIHFLRIVLDECQMIRSSTTKIASTCRNISSDYRWMVSGTPLYSSIYDLNGILAFLKVWPFSLSDAEDGFYSHKIALPWANFDPDALKLVQELCVRIIMRHTKGQMCITETGDLGDPILDLPGASSVYHPLLLSSSHKYVQNFCEYRCRLELERRLDVELIGDTSNLISLPLLCSTSPSIENGPQKGLMHGLDKIMRMTILNSVGMDANEILNSYGLKTLSPQDAMEALMRPLVDEGTTRDIEAGYVRHDAKERGLYNRGRSYAIGLTVKQKFEEAQQKYNTINKDLLAVKSRLPKLRWKAAVERAQGYMLVSFKRSSYGMLKKLFKHIKSRSAAKSTEEDLGLGMKFTSYLQRLLDEYVLKSSELEKQLIHLKPYMSLLEKAIEVGGSSLNASVCEQSGFQGLNDLQEGKKPTCCICLNPVEEPAVTRCVHISCGKCILAWLDASSVLNQSKGSAPCPLCRQKFTLKSLIRISDETDKDEKAEQKKKLKQKQRKPKEMKSTEPSICPPMDEEMFSYIKAPNFFANRDPRYPALSRHLLFLGHLHKVKAPRYISPKEKFIQERLQLAKQSKQKIVIFSQFATSLKHLSRKLDKWNIVHRSIHGGMNKEDRESGIGEFNINPECVCFLLHVSAAAAGLTLTKAKSCIMLEPFLSSGDELQAMNRIHRIGQNQNVESVTLYIKGTIEERILAWRILNDKNKDSKSDDDLAVLADGRQTYVENIKKLKTFFGIEEKSKDAVSNS